MGAQQTADDIQRGAEKVARQDWVERGGTIGFVAKGFLYISVAGIAGSVGLTGGGEASQTGAISRLSEESYGTVLLVLLAIGLACHAAMRLLHVLINPSGDDGLKGVGMRVSYLARALLYGGLCVFTVTELFGGDNGGGGSEQRLTGRLLELPGGTIIVAIIALTMLGVGLHQLWQAWSADFMDHLQGATAQQRRRTELVGRIGHAARGVVFGTIGVLFGQAALQSDASEAGGVDAALDAISATPWGTVALALAALGLAAFGLFCWALAAWGTVRHAG